MALLRRQRDGLDFGDFKSLRCQLFADRVVIIALFQELLDDQQSCDVGRAVARINAGYIRDQKLGKALKKMSR